MATKTNMNHKLTFVAALLVGGAFVGTGPLAAQEGTMKSDRLEIRLDEATQEPLELSNLETGEQMSIVPGSSFRLELDKLEPPRGVPKHLVGEPPCIVLEAGQCTVSDVAQKQGTDGVTIRTVRFQHEQGVVTVTYTLGADDHFLEKQVRFEPSFPEPYLLRRVTVQQCSFGEPRPQAIRTHLHGHCQTHFAERGQTGVFFGLEYIREDAGMKDPSGPIELAYLANIRMEGGQAYTAEKVFWGTYRVLGIDTPTIVAQAKSCRQTPTPYDYGAALAMNEMTSKLFPRLHDRIVTCTLNGWESGFPKGGGLPDMAYLLSIKDALGEFYVDQASTWGGMYPQMKHLTPEVEVQPTSDEQIEQMKKAAGLGIHLSNWHPMLAIHPWMKAFLYCPEKTDWILLNEDGGPSQYNCPANREFIDWLTRLNVNSTRAVGYAGYGQDEMLGRGIDLACYADQHDHLPGDASYTYFSERRRFLGALRQAFGAQYRLEGYRPQQDMGIWDCRHLDSLFTLSEMRGVVGASDAIRAFSRTRYFGHFLPSHLDMALITPGKGDIDAAMLSALAVSDNLLFYWKNPSPEAAARVRHWLTWARERPAIMKVQPVFLPDDPALPVCERYLRIANGGGYAFLFNPSAASAKAKVPLDHMVGLDPAREYDLKVEYVSSSKGSGENPVPGQSADVAVPERQAARGEALVTLLPGSAVLVAIKGR